MAIDQNTLLRFLTQQGGGDFPNTPISGIGGGTPLSGLMLGEQGMGLDGGGGMLAGQGGGGGQAAGVGVDISQLLTMLQGAGVAPVGVGFGGGQALGQGGGGALGAGFGTGGQLLPPQVGVPQGMLPQGMPGQTELSGSQSVAGILRSIKELLGLGRTVGGALSSPTGGVRGFQTAPTTASPTVSDRTFPPDQFNLGQLMTAGEALPGFPAGAAGIRGLGGGTFSEAGNILPAFPSPTEFLGPGGAPAGAGELGPAAGQGADTGRLFGGTGGFGAGLGALGGLAGALTAPNDPGRAFSSLAAAGSLASLFDPTGISEILALIGGGGGLLSGFGLFGDGHTQGSHITLPGVSPGGFDTRTEGGTQTVFKSFNEGLGSILPFERAVQAAKTPESLVAAFNQQYSPFPGQFRVESHGPAGDFINLGGTPSFPTWSPWTAAALRNPAVLANLDVQAGMLGAPAEQPGVISELQAFLPTFPWTG